MLVCLVENSTGMLSWKGIILCGWVSQNHIGKLFELSWSISRIRCVDIAMPILLTLRFITGKYVLMLICKCPNLEISPQNVVFAIFYMPLV